MSDRNKRERKKTGARLSALVIAVPMGLFSFFLLFLTRLVPELLPLIWLLALIPLAILAGVLWALEQRLDEIDGGEEDDAARY